jgi:hypothetical protein
VTTIYRVLSVPQPTLPLTVEFAGKTVVPDGSVVTPAGANANPSRLAETVAGGGGGFAAVRQAAVRARPLSAKLG